MVDTPAPAPTSTPASAPAPAPSPTPAPAPSPAPAATFDWATTGLDADSLNFVTTKGWKGAPDVVSSYRNLEKLTGSLDKIITMPTDDKPESWGAFYDKLGRPKDAAEYQLPVPQGESPDFAKVAAGWFHEVGLTPKQAQALATKWNEHTKAARDGDLQTRQAAVAVEDSKLRNDWSGEYDANVGKAQSAARAFGIDAATIDKLEHAMGFADVMKLFHAIGSRIAVDDTFVGNNGGGPQGFGGFSQEQARARIAELQGDKAWGRRYATGDAEARREMTRLQQIAYPGVTTV